MKPNFLNLIHRPIIFKHFAPEAQSVFIAGDFNQWKPQASRLKKGRNGRWSVCLFLKPGRYEYRYFVDGQWQCSSDSAVCVPNPFGSWNCVIEVR